MSTDDSTRKVARVSIAVTAVIVAVMAIWGFKALTAPIEDDSSPVGSAATDDTTCAPGEQATIVEFVRRSEVVVSVYNAGDKAGRARSTLDLFENAGFGPGAVGNAPTGTAVTRAEVHAKKSDATKAALVAKALGKNTQVLIDDADVIGPGVNVFIGDKFRRLDPDAPTRLKLPTPRVSCD